VEEIAVIVLAADGRLINGVPVQLSLHDGHPLLEHIIARVVGWGAAANAVVLGAHAERILDEVDLDSVDAIINPEWREGTASSLRVGLDALLRTHPQSSAALLVPGDVADLDIDLVTEMVDRYRVDRPQAVVPKYRFEWGPPVLVDSSVWARLMSLEGEADALELLKAHPSWVVEAWFDAQAPRSVGTMA
jgi:molybdenum cofactor cytidylyltransferase